MTAGAASCCCTAGCVSGTAAAGCSCCTAWRAPWSCVCAAVYTTLAARTIIFFSWKETGDASIIKQTLAASYVRCHAANWLKGNCSLKATSCAKLPGARRPNSCSNMSSLSVSAAASLLLLLLLLLLRLRRCPVRRVAGLGSLAVCGRSSAWRSSECQRLAVAVLRLLLLRTAALNDQLSERRRYNDVAHQDGYSLHVWLASEGNVQEHRSNVHLLWPLREVYDGGALLAGNAHQVRCR